MKNRLISNYILNLGLVICFLIGSIGANGSPQETGDVIIWDAKTGGLIYVIGVPDQYIDKDNNPKVPLEIILTKEGKSPIVLAPSNTLTIPFLNDNLSGIYTLEMSIDDFTFIKDVQF